MKKYENFCASLKNMKEIFDYEEPYNKAGMSYNAAASATLRQWITDERRYYVSHFVSAWNYAIE